MKVLLAGATGAIGTPLVHLLQEAGHEVVGLTRSQSGVRKLESAGARGVVGDALDRDALLAALDGLAADAVVHQLTALSKAPMKYSDLDATNALRSRGTENLLAAARALGAARFVTQSFFGGYGYADHGERPLTEEDSFGRPRGDRSDPIVEALGTNEQMVRGSSDLEGVALRFGFFYGEGTTFVAGLRKRALPVPPSGKVLPWIHHDDAAAATLAALEHGRPGQAYNVVDDEPATWREVIIAGASALGENRPRTMPTWLLRMVAPMAAALMVDVSMRLSADKAHHELGWRPQLPTYREGVVQMAERS